MVDHQKFPIKAYSAKELCGLYGVAKSTFLKWIRPHQHEIGPRDGHMYSPQQIKKIIDVLGPPFPYEE